MSNSFVEKHTIDGVLHKHHNFLLNAPEKQISHVPVVNLAYLSNQTQENNFPVTQYKFNSIPMSFADFKRCFFASPLEHFCLSCANMGTQPLSLNQTFVDTTNNKQKFSLNYALQHAWSECNKLPMSSIPINKKINLTKHSGKVRCLGSLVYGVQNALSYNEAIQSLIDAGEIVPAASDIHASAIVDFIIVAEYLFPPLEVSLFLQFPYRVSIPGYGNKTEPNILYSKDITPPRKIFTFESYEDVEQEKLDEKHLHFQEDFNETSSESSDKKKENYEYLIDDNNTMISESSNIIEKVSKIIKGDESVAESKMW
jgi:hypothetical protein